MTDMLFMNGSVWQAPGTSKGFPGGRYAMLHQRLPSDPVFIADVTITNAVIGSSYILLGPDEATVLAGPGTISTDPQTLSNVSAFSDTYVIELRLRKATSGARYKRLNQFVVHSMTGSGFYVAQEIDNVLP